MSDSMYNTIDSIPYIHASEERDSLFVVVLKYFKQQVDSSELAEKLTKEYFDNLISTIKQLEQFDNTLQKQGFTKEAHLLYKKDNTNLHITLSKYYAFYNSETKRTSDQYLISDRNFEIELAKFQEKG